MQARAVLTGLALGALLASASALADTRPPAVETCLGCHGISGYKNAYPTFLLMAPLSETIESAAKGEETCTSPA